MADGISSQTKPRIFRCPNCGDFVTEKPNVSVYQCSNCFATLQAVHRRKEVNQSSLEVDQEGGSWDFRREDNPGSNSGSSRSYKHDLRPRASQSTGSETRVGTSREVNSEESQGSGSGGRGGHSHARLGFEQKQVANFGENRRSKFELGKGSLADESRQETIKEGKNKQTLKGNADSFATLTKIQRKLSPGFVEGDVSSEAFRGLNAGLMKDKKMPDYAEGGLTGLPMKPGNSSYGNQKVDSIINIDPIQLLRELDELRDHIIRSSQMYKQAASPAYHHPQDATRVTKGSPLVDTVSARHSSLPFGQNVGVSNFSSRTPGYASIGGDGELQSLHAVESPYHASKVGNYPIAGPLEHEIHVSRRFANLSLDSDKLSSLGRVNKLPNGDKHPCPLVACAAPFVLCWSCCELLRLPEKTKVLAGKQCRLRCGSCSELLFLRYDGKKLVTCPASPSMASNGARKITDYEANNRLHRLGQRDAKSMNSDSDYEGSNSSVHSWEQNVTFPSISRHGLLSKEPSPPKLSDFENMHVISKPDNRPKGFQSTDGGRASRGSIDLLSDDEVLSEGNQSYRSIEDMAAENTLSIEDSPRSSTSHYPSYFTDRDGVEDLNEQQFAGPATKKSHRVHLFHHLKKGSSPKVSINGHPISDRLIKKAEKKAGPILPGEYWYDKRAGFWGVMGQQCLGIIPPFIEEFNFPLPKNCAGGDTGILVNGRELHDRDFDLLISRGLPPVAYQSYILEISGKVFNAVSGEEICTIRKLAPTIKKLKRGFGMQVPKH